MKKIFFFLLLVSFAIQASANNVKTILCEKFERMDFSNKDEFFYNLLIFDDYLGYRDGLKVLLTDSWESMERDNKITSINLLPAEKESMDLVFDKLKQFPEGQKRKMYANSLPKLSECESVNVSRKMLKLKDKLYEEERALFKKRTGGKLFGERPLEFFTLTNQSERPQKDFVYSYFLDNQSGSPVIVLKVAQVVPNGVLVYLDAPLSWFANYGISSRKNIFIKTTTEYVDQDNLKNGFYQYIGPRSYDSILGVGRTVHEFQEVQNPMEDIYFYRGE